MSKASQILGVTLTISSVLGLRYLLKLLERTLEEEERIREEQGYMRG